MISVHSSSSGSCSSSAELSDESCTLPKTRCITLLTDFSGLNAPAISLRGLGVCFEDVAASDSWSVARTFLLRNHRCSVVYTDVHSRPFAYHDLDLYVAGPPCQPFSSAGKNLGEADPAGRGILFWESVKFIELCCPRTFLLENSPRVRSHKKGEFFRKLLRRLRQAGYKVCFDILNTKDHGLPQFRARLYIVGIRLDVGGSKSFTFPSRIHSMPLEEILAPRCASDSSSRLPPAFARGARARVLEARASLPARLLHRDWMIDDHASAGWASKARDVCPCLLFSQSGGRFVGSRGRRMSFEEAARVQGIVATTWLWPPKFRDCFRLIGNTMSICILDRIFVRLLPILCPGTNLQDPWLNDSAQARLRAAALGFSHERRADSNDVHVVLHEPQQTVLPWATQLTTGC